MAHPSCINSAVQYLETYQLRSASLFNASPSINLLIRSLLILFISTTLTSAFTLPPRYNDTSNEKLYIRSPSFPFEARHDITSGEYQKLFDTLIPQGYRLLIVTGYVVGGVDHFAALFEKSPGPPQICFHGLTSSGYQGKFDIVTAQGYRPVLVNGYTSSSGLDNYAVIFEKPNTSPPWVARHGMTGPGYQAEFNTWVGRGFKLTWVSGYGVGSEARYAAIFEKPTSSPAWVARHGLTSQQYQTEFNAQVAAGFTLTLVNGYTVGNVDYYAAIFEKLSNVKPWIARHGLTSQGYQNEFTILDHQGYRLRGLSGYTISDTSRFAAIWRKD